MGTPCAAVCVPVFSRALVGARGNFFARRGTAPFFTVFEGVPVCVCMLFAERAMIVSPADTCVTGVDCLFPAAFCAVLCPSLHATRHAHASRTSPLRGCLWHPLRGWWPLLQCAGYRRHEFPPNAGEEGHLLRHESESRGFERGACAGGGCTLRPPRPALRTEPTSRGPLQTPTRPSCSAQRARCSRPPSTLPSVRAPPGSPLGVKGAFLVPLRAALRPLAASAHARVEAAARRQ